MIEILEWAFALVLLVVFAWFSYMSSVLVHEKKERQRKGLTDYYDNPIEKE